MTHYSVRWDTPALRDLDDLPQHIAKRIFDKVESYLVKDPQNLGTPMVGYHSELYRYRFNDYRILYQIIKQELIIVVVRVGHRKEVYE